MADWLEEKKEWNLWTQTPIILSIFWMFIGIIGIIELFFIKKLRKK